MTVAMNCDMGESFGLYKLGDDEGMMPLISVANVACGFHGSALFGTGLTRALEGEAALWVEAFNRARGPKLAVDIPSGLHGDSGEPLGATVRADVTVTFAAAKHGLVAEAARPFVGRIIVAPLGIPIPPGWEAKG